ncbi:hypothetical protein [Christiangramia sp.]|uniref:hypothetical protein n=1 Tax=Christiangramia sp. TaxID=1931228 RepID=UPI002629ACF4|nr:hypothetical protein [Christiangramia sp.]
MKYIGYILILFLIISCRSKKEVSEKQETLRIDTVEVYRTQIDTVFKDRVIEKTKPVYFETEIPCDSNQTGKVGSGNNYTEYSIKDGRILLRTNIDSISNSWQSYYRTQFKQDSIQVRKELKEGYSSTSVTVRYVYPWWIWLLGGVIILFAGLWIYTKFFTPL